MHMDAHCPKDWLAAHFIALPVLDGHVVFNLLIFPEVSLLSVYFHLDNKYFFSSFP